MQSKSYRLDRYMRKHAHVSMSQVRNLIAEKRIFIDGDAASNIHQAIGEFTQVVFDKRILQSNIPRYFFVNKPRGVVSATKDAKHKTVLDLVPERERDGLHIVGRLDFNSTGLVLLTNDGRWSSAVNSAHNKVEKFYRVTLDKPVCSELVEAFARGIYFAYEDITTRPAAIKLRSPTEAEVILTEGRYHQIKRMFGAFQIEVLSLHRYAIGNFELDDAIQPGEFHAISPARAQTLCRHTQPTTLPPTME